MRRVWLTILLALALTASGMANAMAAPACPMQEAAGSSSSHHDCCDENGAPAEEPSEEMTGCMIGMACRAAPAVAPTLAPITLADATIPLSQPMTSDPAELSGPLQELFRPPRTI